MSLELHLPIHYGKGLYVGGVLGVTNPVISRPDPWITEETGLLLRMSKYGSWWFYPRSCAVLWQSVGRKSSE